MYFPESMNFQYFFFATYIGYFFGSIALCADSWHNIRHNKVHEGPRIACKQENILMRFCLLYHGAYMFGNRLGFNAHILV